MGIQEIVDVINNTGVAQVTDTQDDKNRITITHRVLPKQLRVWLGIVKYVLRHKDGWKAFIAKQYFLRPSDGELIYCWKFIAQWEDETLDIRRQVATLIKRGGDEISCGGGVQLDSYPLVAGVDRNVPQGTHNARASGPMTGGLSQRGAHRIGGRA